ncbi:hypothetical protein GGR21_002068 [Dysgonomonas hofstadii]|uniref:Lipocalin-like domain-containing protein n=1 Tax=Dysgonomonas hofstadii TaxID=637886 RepID=A0A840CJE3_9BACT|nr:hypothetical protein [Dysgonomonas hofstadii]MBB4036167.1 hypothetical protein [Dysgonomonas hofstadii]
MNKNTFSLLAILIICLSFLSCGDDEKAERPTILGEWYTTGWFLDTGNEEIDDWINGLLRQDLKDFIIKREFIPIENGDGTIGAVYTTSKEIDSPNGPDFRSRQGTYKIEGNVIYLDEEQFNTSEATIQIGEKIMITEIKVDKAYLTTLLSVLFSLTSSQIPDGTTGTLKMYEAR